MDYFIEVKLTMKTSKFWKKQEKEIIIHGSKMNIIESCVDRHAGNLELKNKVALSFEDEKSTIKEYTYWELEKEVNRFANLLKTKYNVKKGSRIAFFLPKCPESYTGFLGTIKSGCIAMPLFEAFQEQGLDLRLQRGDVNVIVTTKKLAKRISKKSRKLKTLKNIVLIDSWKHKRQLKKQSEEFKPVLVDKNQTAMMIFTSSTAGTPVAGIEISHYALVQQHYTGHAVLGLNNKSKYWCTAHPGWVTGSVYGIVSPLSIGASIYVLEGRFNSKTWISFLKKNKISVLYTAPTALRLLKGEIKKLDLKQLKTLGSVGEALTKTTYDFYKKLGVEINDTYWQTETGAIVIATMQGEKRKRGTIGKAVKGINVQVKNKVIVIEKPWPAMMTGIYKHEKMYKDYFDGKWFKTNDLAKKDKQGFFYFEGRHDDIIKTSGERVSPIEIESILMKHSAVKEAAVIGIPDKIRGSILKAFIILNSKVKNKKDKKSDEQLQKDIGMFVKKNYAGHAYPKQVEFVSELPKTNSGKIIRMKLREDELKKSK